LVKNSQAVECVQFSVPGEPLEYFQIYGPTPKEVLSRYTALTFIFESCS
jgi:alpha-D-xyloside xylohydrolase